VFKVDFFVDDKKLGTALKALVGIAISQPTAVPVVNAQVKNGHIKAKGSGENMLALFTTYVQKTEKKELTPSDIRKFLKEHGKSPSSMSYLMHQAVKQKLVKRAGNTNHMVYHPIKG
jgi:endonuclease IV